MLKVLGSIPRTGVNKKERDEVKWSRVEWTECWQRVERC